MNRLRRILDRIRAAEPAWLATKRKAFIPPIAGAVVGLAARQGIELTTLQAELVGLAVTSGVTWLIPNKPAAPPAP